MKRLVLIVGLVACSEDKPKKAPQATSKTPPAPSIGATTDAVEMLPSDGSPMNPFTIAEYSKEFASSTAVVVAKKFPAKLSPLAGAGVNLFALGKNVSWAIDGEPSSGFVLWIDDNANGDLSDDTARKFSKVGDVWEYQLTEAVPPAFGVDPVPAPTRLRFGKEGLRKQSALVRRGTLPLPKAPMKFALIGEHGQFGLDHHYIAFDLDRDGKLDLEQLDNPELFHVFEKTITIDDASYAFELVPDGSRLGLRPLKEKLAPRPPLSTGTPAPDFTVKDLDGKQVSLASLRGKVVLIDFWTTSCHPCIKSLPRLAELHAQYKAKGFELLAVASPSDDVRETLGANRAGISAIDEPAQSLYRVDRYPMQFLIGRDGNILCSRCQLAKVEQLLAETLR